MSTPLLDESLQGSVYLAKQGDNPFGSLLALYVALNDPQTGVVVKLAGKVEPDPATGQLRTTFTNNPQLPVEDFDFDFFGGPRAALTTPPTCGTHTTTADPDPVDSPRRRQRLPLDSFVDSAARRWAAAQRSADAPRPELRAGTATPLAGAYSPFVLKLGRENGTQRLGAVSATLPRACRQAGRGAALL